MAVKRQGNWLGQQRVDTPHLRQVEAAVAGDFDDLAGAFMAGGRAMIASGMTISMATAIGGLATNLFLNVAGSVLLHSTASEPGTIFTIPADQPAEQLVSSNPSTSGTFVPGTTNYIGVDLVRQADNETRDIVKFRSARSKQEFSQNVPLARVLKYRIVISTRDFERQPTVLPIAKVQLDNAGYVQSVTDCRQMLFRLGRGGTVPNPTQSYPFQNRHENPATSTSNLIDPFSGGDKGIGDFWTFARSMQTRLWEVGGGEFWYSNTSDRDVHFVRSPAGLFLDNENFEWDGANLHWQGLSVVFANSTATKNIIADQTTNLTGLTDLADGEVVYVDFDRAMDGATLTPHKATIGNVGTPTVPGSRYIIAWRVGANVYTRDQVMNVGFGQPRATTTQFGVVQLLSSYYNFPTTGPVVPVADGSGNVQAHGVTRWDDGILALGGGAHDSEVDIGKTGALTKVLGTLEVVGGVTFDGKGTSAATADADGANTLTTKGWVLSKIPVVPAAPGIATTTVDGLVKTYTADADPKAVIVDSSGRAIAGGLLLGGANATSATVAQVNDGGSNPISLLIDRTTSVGGTNGVMLYSGGGINAGAGAVWCKSNSSGIDRAADIFITDRGNVGDTYLRLAQYVNNNLSQVSDLTFSKLLNLIGGSGQNADGLHSHGSIFAGRPGCGGIINGNGTFNSGWGITAVNITSGKYHVEFNTPPGYSNPLVFVQGQGQDGGGDGGRVSAIDNWHANYVEYRMFNNNGDNNTGNGAFAHFILVWFLK